MTDYEKNKIKEYVYQLIIDNAESEKDNADSWATCDKDNKENEKLCQENIISEKKRFDSFIDNIK